MNDHKRDDDRLEPDKIPENLVAVHEVPDEAAGRILVGFLRDQGIDATLAPVEISMLPGVESAGHGYWGQVEVLERDADEAKALIRDYLSSPTSQDSNTAGVSGPSGPDDEPEDAA
ncbi:MAG TPA: hypothetical protein VGQ14_06205 [Candidatus Eisenbacteria bacterium]|nr:hypothetical protein [Candidatus Eisenbacteria bacterium]